MSLLHRRWRRRLSLLALGALAGGEEAATRDHLLGCAACRRELSDLQAALEIVDQDPLRDAEPPLAASVLAGRVLATVDARGRQGASGLSPAAASYRPALAAALAVLLALVALQPKAPIAPPAQEMVVSDEAVRRMEREVAREHAARYLSEAQDVLLTVTASPEDCDREEQRLDVEAEARRSRELLARRALVVDIEGEAVASARPVLEDVERLLREVAALPSCVRAGEVDAIHREMSRSRLLMKIDLMTRELQG
jgi:hypothetical protein